MAGEPVVVVTSVQHLSLQGQGVLHSVVDILSFWRAISLHGAGNQHLRVDRHSLYQPVSKHTPVQRLLWFVWASSVDTLFQWASLAACRSMDKAEALASQMATGAQVVSLDQLNAGNTPARPTKLIEHSRTAEATYPFALMPDP